MDIGKRNIERWLRVASLAIVFAGLMLLADSLWLVPEPMSAKEYHALGTSSQEVRFARRPRPCTVSVPPVRKSVLDIAVDYLRDAGAPQTLEKGAYYDPRGRRVVIVHEVLRAQASLPEPMRRQLYHAIRHEYGHAFTEDVLREVYARGPHKGQAAVSYQPRWAVQPAMFDPDVRPVVREYQAQPPQLYGISYLTSTFGEYMAESYARFLEGRDVPPVTRAFLASHSQGR